jgi:hypothetical protein
MCSRRKKTGVPDNWTEKIKQLTTEGIHDIDSLLEQLPGEEAVKQLRLLMDEGIIAINSEGKLVWVNP